MSEKELSLNTSPASVTEIVPETVYAIGGRIATDEGLPWLPKNARGLVPFQCFALKSQGRFVLIDGGLTVHRSEISAGLVALVKDTNERAMMITRRDTDAIINMPWLLRDFGIKKVYLGSGDVSPLDFFESLEHSAAVAQMHVISTYAPAEWLAPGLKMKIGELEVEFLRTSLRVLSTNWIYESTTKTLFSSDSWAFLTCSQKLSPLVVQPEANEITTEMIMEFLDVKFDWLRAIDTTAIIADLELIRRRHIERICPSFGRVIEGRAAVEIVLARTVEALGHMARLPRRSLLTGFDWSCCNAS